MRHPAALLMLSLAIAMTAPARAGEPGYKKCSLDTQTCLNQMVARLKGRGWLGIEYDFDKGSSIPKVTRIVPGSPAEASGFKAGDLLVSVNGVKFTDNTEDKCATCEATKEIWKPGTRVHYVVRRKGKDLRLGPTLAELPTDVMAQMIGMHMLEHAQPEAEAAKK